MLSCNMRYIIIHTVFKEHCMYNVQIQLKNHLQLEHALTHDLKTAETYNLDCTCFLEIFLFYHQSNRRSLKDRHLLNTNYRECVLKRYQGQYKEIYIGVLIFPNSFH